MSASEAQAELVSQYVTGRFSFLGYAHAAPCQMFVGFETGDIKLASSFTLSAYKARVFVLFGRSWKLGWPT